MCFIDYVHNAIICGILLHRVTRTWTLPMNYKVNNTKTNNSMNYIKKHKRQMLNYHNRFVHIHSVTLRGPFLFVYQLVSVGDEMKQQQQQQQEQSSLHDATDFIGDLSNEDEGLTFSLPPAVSSSTPSPTADGQVCLSMIQRHLYIEVTVQ